jgi:hypothetical protein
MNKYDEKYFARHALGSGTDFEWDDPYVDDYDYEDDPSLPFDDDVFAQGGDEPMEDDLLFEEE